MDPNTRQTHSGDPASAAHRGSVAAQIEAELPFLRRYARALTGNQESGDRFAVATLEALLKDRSPLDGGLPPRIILFRTMHSVWSAAGAPADAEASSEPERRAQSRLRSLTPYTREALLLSTIEEFSDAEVGQIMRVPEAEATDLIGVAYREMEQSVPGQVLIIEDEPLIALDLRTIVEEMGHQVTGIARTAREAVGLAHAEPPDLILSDIRLADDSSGIAAVKVVGEELGEIPVIFITAFPERLLTGERPEPALLIPKPYRYSYVRTAISQGMFFSTIERVLA
jgi:DNA-directed RNA polymerase specialized sigma24 family protein/CheY-like chemotaxis protein